MYPCYWNRWWWRCVIAINICSLRLYFSMQFLDLYKKIYLKRYILIRSSWFYQSLITLMKFFHWYQIPIWFKTASKSRKLIWHDLSLHFSCIFIFMYICLNMYFNANTNLWCMLYVYFKLISTVRIKWNYELLFHPIQLRDTVVESCQTSSRIACYSSELVNCSIQLIWDFVRELFCASLYGRHYSK